MRDKAKQSHVSRRSYLKLGAGATTLSLAGCLGQAGDDGLTQVDMVIAPIQLGAPFYLNQWDEDGTLQEEYFEPEGYEINFEFSWEEIPLLAGEEADIVSMSVQDATNLALEQGRNISLFGACLTSVHSYGVKAGGEYDPANTGSPQATMDKLVEDQGLFGIRSWATSNLPFTQTIVNEFFGHELAEEGGDFNVQTSEYSTIPELIMNDELAAGVVMPMGGGGVSQLQNDEIVTLWWERNIYEEQDWGFPMMQNIACYSDFADENPGAVRAALRAWDDAASEIHATIDEVIQDAESYEHFGVGSEQDAQFLADLYINVETDFIKYPCVFEDVRVTDEVLEQWHRSEQKAAELGYVPEEWDEVVDFLQPDDIDL